MLILKREMMKKIIFLFGLLSIHAGNMSLGQILTDIAGALKISSSGVLDQEPDAGTIQWHENDFVGYNGAKWVSLTTGIAYDGTVSDADGNTYFTIIIEGQEWMAENLRTTKYNDDSAIDLITASNSWGKTNLASQGAYCWYDNNMDDYKTMGALYNWYAINTAKLCPEGWRVPSESDWNTLQTNLGGSGQAGGKLKAEHEVFWQTPNVGATNEVGFSAQPAGIRLFNGNFDSKYFLAYFWTSDQVSSNGKDRSILAILANLYSTSSDKRFGYSVRCIKN